MLINSERQGVHGKPQFYLATRQEFLEIQIIHRFLSPRNFGGVRTMVIFSKKYIIQRSSGIIRFADDASFL